ncbi:MAG: diguanylate cyclase response regulator [Nitrospirales bacterium]|nr:MAG: diguanylate cyclase response regulator [Nitrospirales bacterium]
MRVLVADDDPLTLHMVVYRLQQWGHEVVTCRDGEEAWNILQSESIPQVAILDWMMPGLDGVQVCRKVRGQSGDPYVYIILLTGRDDTQDLIAGLEAGADDYLCKPFNLGELEARLRSGKRIVDLQAELIAARETLRVQAMQDPLTKSLNHGAIMDYLHRELARAGRDNLPLSLIMVDLDKFKQVNDTFGHLAGDYVLVETTRRFHECLRPYDAIGRYGGEEFLIVLPGSDAEIAMKQAGRIQALLQEEPILISDSAIAITVSQGVTTWEPSCSEDVRSLINAADNALYLVKSSGRNGVEFIAYDHAKQTENLIVPRHDI